VLVLQENRTQFFTTHAKEITPFGEGTCAPIQNQHDVCSTIAVLLFGRCPTAISRFVVTVVVDAIERVKRTSTFARSLWTFAHVCKEILKRLPTFANDDAAHPVIRPTQVIGVRTSADHRRPCSVFSRFFSWTALTVCSTCQPEFLSKFNAKAPARAGTRRCSLDGTLCDTKRDRPHDTSVSAITKAFPFGWCNTIDTFGLNSANNFQTSDFFTSQVNKFHAVIIPHFLKGCLL
jgi:hypothetical protein